MDIERAESGQILAVTTDMNQMNQLKASILQRVQEQLGEHLDTGVPLGTLLGSELLHGRGPNIPVRLSLSGNVTADFESTFESAGINQTKHRICLRVHASIYSFLPPAYNGTTEITTDIPVAETVIIGEVPQLMANIQREFFQHPFTRIGWMEYNQTNRKRAAGRDTPAASLTAGAWKMLAQKKEKKPWKNKR